MDAEYVFQNSSWGRESENTSETLAQFPDDVDETKEHNDLTILKGSMSTDELVSDQDVMNVEDIIEQGRSEERVANESDFSQWSVSIWNLIARGSINLVLPFINGMMLGFGEILAHEIGFRYNYVGARVQPPRRMERKQVADRFL